MMMMMKKMNMKKKEREKKRRRMKSESESAIILLASLVYVSLTCLFIPIRQRVLLLSFQSFIH